MWRRKRGIKKNSASTGQMIREKMMLEARGLKETNTGAIVIGMHQSEMQNNKKTITKYAWIFLCEI